MESFFGLESTGNPRSGGKIATKRYRTHNTTPYDRPPASSESEQPPKRSNWISDVILPTTRMIASGAAKIFTSVFDSDDDSSLSSSDSTHASDNEIGIDHYYETCNGFISINGDPGATSETLKNINEDDPQVIAHKSDADYVEQLLLDGRFSRQECDKFLQIINSRVSGAADTLGNNLGGDADDRFSKSVLETRKWLEEKKSGHSPLSYWNDLSNDSTFFSRKQIDNGVGSPTDVAKSYMKYRPPWASPSAEHVLTSPLSSRCQGIRQLLSLPPGEESSSSFKKRSCLASGSWNIQDEIRKVRSKATEDLLQSSPSLKVRDILASGSSSFTREDGNKLKSAVSSKTRDSLKRIAAPETIPKVGGNETVNAVEASFLPCKKTTGELLTSLNTGPVSSDVGDDPRLMHYHDSAVVEEIGKCDVTENVDKYSTSLKATLSAEVGGIIQKIQSQLSEKKGDEMVVGNTTSNVENKHECASEAFVEVVPDVHETAESFDNFSQGSGMVNEELPLANLVKGIAKEAPRGGGGGMQMKQEGRKITGKYSRRSKLKK